MPLKRVHTNVLAGASLQAGSVSGWTSAQNNVARQLMMYYLGAGWSKAGAAGMIGNQYQESALDPTVIQSNGEGHYLSQWGGQRVVALESFASSLGLPATSVEAQARFTIREVQTGYKSLDTLLKTTKSPSDAAVAISNQYERPAASAANNSGRADYANKAYTGLTGASVPSGGANNVPGGTGGGGPSSILDLLTSPVDTIGGWLASIAVTLVKDAAIGIGDAIVLPFLHWQQRAVMDYYETMFSKKAWPILPWTATFWGLGYWLLFTDPANGALSMKPGPVRNSRIGSHVRLAQSVPARKELIRPKDVTSKTPTKPKPVTSAASVTHVRTLRTHRPSPVRVTGDTVDRRTDTDTISPPTSGRPRRAGKPSTVPHKSDRARHNPLPDSSGGTRGGTTESGRDRSTSRRGGVSREPARSGGRPTEDS